MVEHLISYFSGNSTFSMHWGQALPPRVSDPMVWGEGQESAVLSGSEVTLVGSTLWKP